MGDVKRTLYTNSIQWRSCEGKYCDQQLIPGIPDDITIAEISPKFTLPVLNNLLVVSYGWLRAIQSRQIYEARRVSNSKAEQTTFVFRRMNEGESFHLTLYSVQDDFIFYLPQIPGFTSSTKVRSFTYTSLDGKLYVMVSFKGDTTPRWKSSSSKAVWRRYTYVYDLVGHIRWERRSNPKFVNQPNECAVMNGKIFVYGAARVRWNGPWNRQLKYAIYDPEKDFWSEVSLGHSVTETGLAPLLGGMHENLTTFDQACWRNCFLTSPWIRNWKGYGSLGLTPIFSSWVFSHHDRFVCPLTAEAINWDKEITVTIMDGKFLKMTQEGLHVYDSHTKAWILLHFESPSELEQIAVLPPGGRTSAQDVKSIIVAAANNVVFSVVKVPSLATSCNSPSAHFLTSRELEVRGKHQVVPVNYGNISDDAWKPIDMASKSNRFLYEGFLRCPVSF